jgi:hypothetical protein
MLVLLCFSLLVAIIFLNLSSDTVHVHYITVGTSVYVIAVHKIYVGSSFLICFNSLITSDFEEVLRVYTQDL